MSKKTPAVPPAEPKFKTEEASPPRKDVPALRKESLPAVGVDVGQILKKISPVGLEDMVQKAQDTGDPLFTKDDLKTTRNPLALILRLLFILENITKRKFEFLHRKMAQESVMPTNNISYNRNNILRSLPQGDCTWNFLDKVLGICGFTLINVTLTLQRNDTKEVFNISQQEALDAIRDNPYPPNVVVSQVTRVEK